MIRKLHEGLGIPLKSLLGVPDLVPDGFVQVDWVLPTSVVEQVTLTANKIGATDDEFVRSMLAIATSVIGDTKTPTMTEEKQQCSADVKPMTDVIFNLKDAA